MRADRFSAAFTTLFLCAALLFTVPGARAAVPGGGKPGSMAPTGQPCNN